MIKFDLIEELLSSIITIVITGLLFFLYFRRKINIIQMILAAYASQSFFISFIGPTISPFFFILMYFYVVECLHILRHSIRVNKNILLIVSLPALSTLFIFTLTILGYDIFESGKASLGGILYNGFFFYLKNFLPLIFLGIRVGRECRNWKMDVFFHAMMQVAIVSCYIALFQLVITKFTDNHYITRIIGIRPEYLNYTSLEGISTGTRISGLFIEPKNLAAFLAISFPIFLQQKKKLYILLLLLVGFLTVSQTFVVGLVVFSIVFFIIKWVRGIRLNISLSLVVIFIFFSLLSSVKQNLVYFYEANSNNYVVNLLFARAVERFDIEDIIDNNEFLGMPLQRDMELPVFKFFLQNPLLYLTGYGLKNGGYISEQYYPDFIAEIRSKGQISYNINMRWFYYTIEFGVIIFFIWLFILTKPFAYTSTFENKYYAFLWVFFFFMEIDIILIFVYIFYSNKAIQANHTDENINSYHFLQPGAVSGRNN